MVVVDKRLLLIGLLLIPAQAWLTGWAYRKPITVTTGVNVNDYSLQMNITYDANMNASFKDIRFTDASDNSLPYWIEDQVDSSWVSVWFKGNFTTANGTQAYLYYGKPTATDQSNGNSVFIEFDDFNDGTVNTSKWEWAAGITVSESGGILTTTGTGGWQQFSGLKDFDNNTITEFYGKMTDTNSVQMGISDINADETAIGSGTDMAHWMYYTSGREYWTGRESAWTKIARTTNLNQYYTLKIIWEPTKVRFYENGTLKATSTTNIPADQMHFSIRHGGTQTTYTDWMRIRNYIQPEPSTSLGAKETEMRVTLFPNPTVINVSTNASFVSVGANYTKFWWDIDNGNTSYYTTVPYVLHQYTAAGSYTINATAYNGANITQSANLVVNEPLYNTTISVDNYLPFIFTEPTTTLSYSTINGSGTFNSSWEITLPNSTKETYINQTPFAFSNRVQGSHSAVLTVCDLVGDSCVTDTQSFHSWNVTGGRSDVIAFNQTQNLIAQLLEGDTITLSSDDSLVWNYSGTATTGTSATFVLNDSYAFYQDADYSHFNVSVKNTWNTYESIKWITMIGANYTVSHSGSCGGKLYCLVGGKMYNETSQLTNGTSWGGVLQTSAGVSHSKESSISTTDNELNVTLCMNATPTISSITLDGTIIYSAYQYAERTYAFQSASIPLSSTCTVDNGKYISFYTMPSADASTITITVLQGGTALTDALVKVQTFSGSSWYTVASQITDMNGQVQFELGLCPTYYKFIVEQEGTTIYTEKTCLKSTARTINVPSAIEESYQIYQNVSTYCGWTNTTSILACTISDPTGKTTVAELNVFPTFSSTAICTESEASTTTTLLCDLSAESDGDYKYELKITTSGSTYLVDFGTITKGAEAGISSDGAVIALYLLILLLFSVKLSPEAVIMFSTLSIFVMKYARIISLPYAVIGWLLPIMMVGIIGLVRKNGK